MNNDIKAKTVLKPCPFCGGPVNVYYSSATKAFFWIHTDKQGRSKDCFEMTPAIMLGKYANLNEAYSAWNRRADKGGHQNDNTRF